MHHHRRHRQYCRSLRAVVTVRLEENNQSRGPEILLSPTPLCPHTKFIT